MKMMGSTLSSEETTYLQLHSTQEVTIGLSTSFEVEVTWKGGWYTTLVLINQLINHKLTPSQWSWLYYDLFSLHTHTHTKTECGLQTPKNPQWSKSLVFASLPLLLLLIGFIALILKLILATSIKTQFCIAKLEGQDEPNLFKTRSTYT